ncbi:MAG: DVUA0089 family protein [Candidatus Electrothrix sp. YB6]
MKAQSIKTGLLATAGIMLCTSAANAAVISEAEPNNSIATAQHIDISSFTVGLNPDITNSEIWPWVSIAGTGDGTFDYYSFDVSLAGTTASVFDTDHNNFDTELFLYDSNGNLLAYNDDNWGDPGSNFLASFLEYTFLEPGTYIIAVGEFNSYDYDNTGGVTGNAPDIGDSYELQISLSRIAIPMDTTGQIVIKNFVYDRDMAAFSLQGMEGIGAAAQDAVDNGTGLTFTAEAGDTLITFTADSNELDVGGNRLVYSDDVTLVRCKFDTELCTVQLRYTNLDGDALDAQLTGEMNVSLEVGGNLYLNTGEWTQVDSGSGSWTKYRKDN